MIAEMVSIRTSISHGPKKGQRVGEVSVTKVTAHLVGFNPDVGGSMVGNNEDDSFRKMDLEMGNPIPMWDLVGFPESCASEFEMTVSGLFRYP